MKLRVVVDTNIIIDHLRGISSATKVMQEIEDGKFEGIISTITIMELFMAPKMNAQRETAVKELLKIFEIAPVDARIAAAAGKLLARYRGSHGLEPMDALIAATASVKDALLFTLNGSSLFGVGNPFIEERANCHQYASIPYMAISS